MTIDTAKQNYIVAAREAQIDPNPSEQYLEFLQYLDGSPEKWQHYLRYCRTFNTLEHALGLICGKDILETGGASPISKFLSRNNKCTATSTDLRIEIDAADNSCDLVFSLEVIEHLKDAPEKTFDEIVLFRETGVRKYASEITRVLRPGGYLLLTTPNPCSYRVAENLAAGLPPMVFRPHVREYTKDELVALFDTLTVSHYETQFNFFHLTSTRQKAWATVFENAGWSTENRGDDHFLLMQKPLRRRL